MEAVSRLEWTSVEDYLTGELQSPVRHEYIGGATYAMAGASDEHITVAMNIAFALRNHLQGKRCKVQLLDGKVRLRIAGQEIFCYHGVNI